MKITLVVILCVLFLIAAAYAQEEMFDDDRYDELEKSSKKKKKNKNKNKNKKHHDHYSYWDYPHAYPPPPFYGPFRPPPYEFPGYARPPLPLPWI